jgi:hypothetical protein
MDNIFEDEIDNAQEELKGHSDSGVDTADIPSDLQEELANIESLVAMSPDVVNSDEYKDLMARIEGYSDEASTEDDDDEEEFEDDDEDSEDDLELEEDDEEEEEEEEEEEDLEDVFGTLTKAKKKKSVKIDFEVPEEMEALLNSRYGIEDAGKFFGSVDTWRAQAQEGAEAKKNYEALASDIQNLPPDLRDSITRWADGDDYTAPFTQGERLDFGSDFDEQDVESLVEHYLPEEYSRLVKSLNKEDGMTEEEFEDKVDLLGRSTKKLFTAEKKALVDRRVQYEKQQEQNLANQKSSALDSVENLSKSYPNFSRSELKKVENILVQGKVDSLFYDSDGSYLEGAAEMVANAMYGKKMQDTIKKLASRRGESKANERIVDTSAKTVKKRKSSGGKGGVNTKAVGHLSSAFETDPYA